jgi:ComF family protein
MGDMGWLHALVRFFVDAVFTPRDTEVVVRTLGKESLLPLLHVYEVRDSKNLVLVKTRAPIVALLPYHDPLVQACILEIKFHGNARALPIIGMVLSKYLQEYVSSPGNSASKPIILVPIPLSKERRKSRGYNQVEEILSATLSLLPKGLAEIDSNLVIRTRNTAPQTSLSGVERRKNMTGVFATTEQPSSAATYIVIDDVTTTGTTLQAACLALKQAGATKVLAVALAH